MINTLQGFLLFLFLFHTSVIAQYDNLKFKHLNSNNGLSQNFISCILQDKMGFIWFGTKDGLNRYDGYNFKVYRHNPFDSTSVSENFILCMYEDSKNRLWVGTDKLNLFLPESDAFKRIDLNLQIDTGVNSDFNKIISITEDKYGIIWLGTDNGLIRYEPEYNRSEIYYFSKNKNQELSDNFISSLSSDDSLVIAGTQNGMKLLNSDLIKGKEFKVREISHLPSKELISSKRSILSQFRASDNIIYAGTPAGLLKINLSAGESDYIPYKDQVFNPQWLSRILSVCRDKNNNLWLAASGSLIIYNPELNTFNYYFHNPKDEQSLSMNSVTSLYTDRGGKIWVGTAGKGINIYDQNRKNFSLYDGFIDKEPFKSSFSVSNIFSDSRGLLWISSQEKLYRVNRKIDEYTRINLLFGEEGEITSVLEDKQKNIWVSSSGGLYKIFPSGNIRHYNHNPLNPNSLRNNFVRLLFIDNRETLYVLNAGYLSKYEEKTESFTHYKLSFVSNDNIDPVIKCILKSDDNEFWFGWTDGLVKYNLDTQNKKIYRYQPGNNMSISNNDVLTICEDPEQPKKYLWVGTQGGGLSRLNLADGTFANFSVEDGLPNNVVYGILSSENDLWLSTNGGLSQVSIDKYGLPSFKNYDVSDGLQGNEFNTGAYCKSNTGELFFGGLNGVSAFFPEDIRDNIYIPPVVITELNFLNRLNEKVTPYKTRNILNNKSEISIPYSENSFTVYFAALDYTASGKNKYMYKLKPINEQWINLGTQRNVTFTELGPGEYELVVRGSNNDGIWNNEGASLLITISPPFWQTTWAYILYTALIVLLFYGLRRYELNRMKLKSRLKQEYFETQKLKELDEMKSGFFANISHEFRTPLTLIIGPSEQLEAQEKDQSKRDKLETIRKNASRLLRLINQILELSKLEKNKYKISFSEGNILEFLRMIVMSFNTIAESKKIQLKLIADQENIPLYFNRDTIEKIFYNLLSNAFKFTPPGGTIEVSVTEVNDGVKKDCRISVKDSGVGIPENELNKIFTKFYQITNSTVYSDQGSGIGLALVKELVGLHYGKVKAKSKLNEGTTFIVTLPLGREHLKDEEVDISKYSSLPVSFNQADQLINEKVELSPSEENTPEYFSEDLNNESLIALVVEDNADIRKYITEQLKQDYKIIEAINGKAGFQKAAEIIPDIIISDVMMPEMNGYIMCEKLKTDIRTSHIPVILLTAKAGEENKMEGLETGADDYLTKPFSSRELSIRVKNLIEIRQKLRKKFSGSLIVKPKEIAAKSIDKIFIEKVLNVIEKNIGNENFSVIDLSREMNISHSQLHRKLKALINQSANQLIRSVKMERALKLLKSNAGSIAEIGYQVGYNDPSYFTKTFSGHFGYLPSEVKNND